MLMGDHRPAGVFEYPAFARGSKDLLDAKAAARAATAIVGGVTPPLSSPTTTSRTSLAMSPLAAVRAWSC